VRATRSQRREARVRPVHSRTRLAFLRKNYARTSFVETAVVFRFCIFRIFLRSLCRPLVYYLYEASLKTVGFVLLHRVAKNQTARQTFWNPSNHCSKSSSYRLAESVNRCGFFLTVRFKLTEANSISSQLLHPTLCNLSTLQSVVPVV